MFLFITDNLATIIGLILLVAVVTLIIIRQISNKREGKNSCGCECSGCSGATVCHSVVKKTDN